MKVLGRRSLCSILAVAVEVSLIIGLGLVICVPFVFRLIPPQVFNIYFFGNSYILSLITFESGLIVLWLILNEVRKILRLLVHGAPFVPAHRVHLLRISWLALSVAVIFLIKIIADFTVLTLLSALFFVVVWVVSRIFAEVVSADGNDRP